MPRNKGSCRGCQVSIPAKDTWCKFCEPVELNGSTVAAITEENGRIMITLVPGSKPRVVYIDPARSCLLAQSSISAGFCPGLAEELKMARAVRLGPRSQGWSCNDCGQTFVWHPGGSDRTEPTECPLCQSEDIHVAEVIEERT